MSIAATCPECSTTIEVGDEHAGKRFRCKSCGAVVMVPQSLDDWEPEFVENEGSDADDLSALKPSRSALPRRARRRSAAEPAAGMPAAVIAAIVLESLLILLNILGIFGNMSSQNVAGACGSFFRILLEGLAISGYVTANNTIRWVSIVLSGIGILLMFGCGAYFTLAGEHLPPQFRDQFPPELLFILIAVLAVQVILFVGLISCLLVPSARDYFEG